MGLDLSQIQGIDETPTLTLIGKLGTDFKKWPSLNHFVCWLGLCPNVKKIGAAARDR